jgi:hypothetical protein
MPVIPLPVRPRDLENLSASGLTRATIRANGLRTENNALVFPYRDLDGSVNCFARRRPHKPVIGKDGKQVKYLQPKGSPLRAYFPVASLDKLRDCTSPVYLTEGEKKALALSQLGLAAIGIGGIWGGCKKGSTELIDDLAAIPWTDRVVYIVFDYDEKASTRCESEAARTRLARALKAKGAGEVYNVELPEGRGPEGEKVKLGVDDFLVFYDAEGADAFQQLVEQAIPVIKIIPGVGGESGGIPVIKIISPPVLGEAAYHGPIGKFLRAVAPHTEATDAGILAHLLPALGVYAGPGPHVWAGTKQYARVNTVLVGPTSTGRKGTALAPVDLLMNFADQEFWKEQRVGGLSTGEGLVTKVADKKKADEDGNEEIIPVEKRLYVVEEEFSKVLAQLRRDGNILSQILRESYDSGNLSVLTRNNPLQAFGAHIAITGHITPEELFDRFNHIEMANGFGNRFLWFAVKSDKVLPRCQPIPKEVFKTLISSIWLLSNRQEQYFPLADASMEKWEKEIYPSLREDKTGLSGALVARGSSMVLRLALIYFLLDPPPKGGSQGIAPVHLDAALAVWRYCEESVQMLFRSRTGTFLGDKILELLADGPKTKDTLNDHLSPKQKAEAGGVLANLEAAVLIRKTTAKKAGAGRPATMWELVK